MVSLKSAMTDKNQKVNELLSGEHDVLTSTSHSALLLVAEVADCRPVVLRKTYCFFLWSSHVRNFSCSAWNNRTTSPCDYIHTHTKTKQLHAQCVIIYYCIFKLFFCSHYLSCCVFNVLIFTMCYICFVAS